ncbi:N-acetylmuramoyl-L-alanine amidase [Lichenicoccus sp.]|uniref:N-acetylmuramoyl-L-alanine amidase n=1 Tax=Lichenicoccus sp. TaxID=2781899 RepID=UPI003D0D01D7
MNSPNQRDRPQDSVIDTLILHYTGMQSGAEAIARLCDPASEVSSHYVVEEDGEVFRLVAEQRRAAHAGVSFWQGRTMLNDSSIGIEIVNPGHEWGYRRFPAQQIAAVRQLCLDIIGRHAIPAARVLGHSDVAPDRKQDPGELFPWRELAQDGIGIWPEDMAESCDSAGVREALLRIGYAPDLPVDIVLRAFQRHWRPETVDGSADSGTRARLHAVAARMQP